MCGGYGDKDPLDAGGRRVSECRNFFFFASRRRHTRFDCDWSSDVCSSDLIVFCGFDGYQDFIPELAAANLSHGWNGGRRSVGAVRVPLPGVKPDRLFTSIDIARSMEDATFRGAVAERLRHAVKDDRARLGL